MFLHSTVLTLNNKYYYYLIIVREIYKFTLFDLYLKVLSEKSLFVQMQRLVNQKKTIKRLPKKDIFVLKLRLSKSKGGQQSSHPTKSQPMFINDNMQMSSSSREHPTAR